MAIVSVTEASKLVGKTRKTIQRYIYPLENYQRL